MPLDLAGQLQKAKAALAKAAFGAFYGTVTFHFENGNIVRVTKHESLRLEDLEDGETTSDKAK